MDLFLELCLEVAKAGIEEFLGDGNGWLWAEEGFGRLLLGMFCGSKWLGLRR